ncbi:MAG: hypothetical protein JWQ09_667 [Segetibacter sp.]|nr:hypothetical protein [Segetibacter sp.]
MTYTCSSCGKQHEGLAAIAFDTPSLSDEDKEKITELTSDFCVIQHEDQTDRYIRAVLFQKVIDHCEDLQYGIWVSLSEKSFNDYKANFHNNDHEAIYFGFLCNWITGYESTLSLHTNVELSKGGSRPQVIPHESDHLFLKDYYNGISIEEAQRRIAEAMTNETI